MQIAIIPGAKNIYSENGVSCEREHWHKSTHRGITPTALRMR
jgi:hypothetical protein